jgi:N-formylglutamate amidohydrolase
MKDPASYIEFLKGDIPLVISVPHGGNLEVDEIPRRTKGVLGIDGETIMIARELVDLIKDFCEKRNIDGRSPSYIMAKVARSRIDLNREESEAFIPHSKLAQQIYRFFHDKIKETVINNLRVYERSILIDLHGFEKANRPPGFRDVDIILGTNNLESFYSSKIPKKEWGNNIRGRIVQKFTELNIPIAPSHPQRREYVLTGGYITKKYGASQIPYSQVIQIELSDKIRIEDLKLRTDVLHALATIFVDELQNIKSI